METKDKKSVLYVSFYKLNNSWDILWEKYMEKYFKKYFDVISIDAINEINIKQYDLVLINAVAFTSRVSTVVSRDVFYRSMEFLKNIKHVAILLHDLHDRSFHLKKLPYNIEKYLKNNKRYQIACSNNPNDSFEKRLL